MAVEPHVLHESRHVDLPQVDNGHGKGVNRRFQADSNTYEYLVALFDSNTNSGQRYSKRIRIVVLGGIRIRSEYE